MKNFRNKVAVITGAGSGIGRGLALRLADEGAALALSDIDTAGVADTAAMCEKVGVKAIPYTLDVADKDAFYQHADDVIGEFGRANLLFNNAGVALGAEVKDMTWEDFEWVMNIDFWGVTYGTKAFLPHLIESGDAHIANVSSVFGLMGIPTQSAYNAAKFAVRGFTESLRQEMKIGKYPVGVTCVHPGGIKTNIIANARGVGADDKAEFMNRGFQLVAFTRPDSAARAIIRGVRANRPRVLIGPDARVFDAIPRVIGPRYQDIGAPFARLGFKVGEKLGIEL
ncbi:SDR family NAD(P)-dependent oxidoreductase [Gordonia sp. CPCC 205333]|uniref:SDR family NAD(P)-dependent oxidoreductase n=1 Tax=Gordonia sp. CPCC 205333 TaxID=3140790 RepID=UPI003AF365E0